MKNLGMIAWWLIVVGALNWGLSVLGFNLVHAIVGMWPMLETLVYALVGLSGVYALAEKFGMM